MTTYHTPQSLIAMIQRVQTPRGRRRAGLFSVEGTRLVERALRAGAPLEDVVVARRLADSGEQRARQLLAALDAAGCRVTMIDDETLDELTEGRDLGPILGLVRLPPRRTLEALLAEQPAPLLLAAVDIVDPGNVGALTRTAHAGGAAAFLAVGHSDPFHPRATRISRGSIFKMPIIEYGATAEFLQDAARRGVALVGTTAQHGTPLPALAWPAQATAVLMGNEAQGLPPEAQAALDAAITIPMPDGVDSYSVNAAAAIVLYVARQARSQTAEM